MASFEEILDLRPARKQAWRGNPNRTKSPTPMTNLKMRPGAKGGCKLELG